MNTDIVDSSEYNSPTIILKKGKVELQIKNAAAIIRKINELHPRDIDYSWNSRWNKINRELSEQEKVKQRKWMDAAQEWFRKEVFGDESSSFEVVVKEKEFMDEDALKVREVFERKFLKESEPTPIYSEEQPTIEEAYKEVKKVIPQPEPVKSKNAYEIRLDILKDSIGFLQWKTTFEKNPNIVPRKEDIPTSDDILEVAQKFYKFVENKR